jgi:hypothetical protein
MSPAFVKWLPFHQSWIRVQPLMFQSDLNTSSQGGDINNRSWFVYILCIG